VLDQPELSGERAHRRDAGTIIAAVSQFELSLIRDRMSEGRKRAKGAGVVFGRPCKVDAKAAKTVKTLKSDGLSVPEISIRTGLSMYRALR
jgi:DNA invertase Pin-like site-specific DNA recombinase